MNKYKCRWHMFKTGKKVPSVEFCASKTNKNTLPSPCGTVLYFLREEQSAEKAAAKVKQSCSGTESWVVYCGAMLTLKVNYSNLSAFLLHLPLFLTPLPPPLASFHPADFEAAAGIRPDATDSPPLHVLYQITFFLLSYSAFFPSTPPRPPLHLPRPPVQSLAVKLVIYLFTSSPFSPGQTDSFSQRAITSVCMCVCTMN